MPGPDTEICPVAMSVRQRTSPHTNTTSAPVSPSSSVRLATAIAFGVILVALRAANEEGTLRVDDPEIVTRFSAGRAQARRDLGGDLPEPVGTRDAVSLDACVDVGLCCDSSG